MWIAGFVALCGLASCALFNLARNVIREIDAFQVNAPAAAPGVATAVPVAIGVERITLLLLGIDERESEQGPWRTDTMILLTIDPAKKTAGMLSIPRDLWVPIPAYDTEARINTAHFIGDAENYPGGGPALAMATVQYNLGLPVHYYVRLNFTAFEKLIDLIGGIDIYVERTIDDPTYPDSGIGYEPLHIDAGWQHMDGRLALKYARTRHTEQGDFERAHHQQQVILAIRDKIVKGDLLATLLGQAGPLIQTLGEAIKTNLTFDQLVELAEIGASIGLENIQVLAIGPSAILPYAAPTNPPQNVLIPIREEVRKLRDQLLSGGSASSNGADDAERLAAEDATIRVENGTGTIGLAAHTREFLAGLGFNIASYGDAYDGSSDYSETRIVDYANKPFTAAKLSAALGLQPMVIHTAALPGDGVDVRVILGDDFANALGAQLMQTPIPSGAPIFRPAPTP
jgi:LCP family protein required for cell wall assembly